jgi:hypothetical protein
MAEDNKSGNKKLDINISSKAAEKALDIAKDFLDKLIMPAVEETGLLLKYPVTAILFKKQVKTLMQAKAYCEKNGISPKSISLKLLCPLLENAALEDDEFLQNKWATLLGNLVDSAQNIENHVFPYLLSQISSDEFRFIEGVVLSHLKERELYRLKLEEYKSLKSMEVHQITTELESLQNQISLEKPIDPRSILANPIPDEVRRVLNLKSRKGDLQTQLKNYVYQEKILLSEATKLARISTDNLRNFEIANLTRLGILKEDHQTVASTQTLEIPNNPNDSYLNVEFDADVYTETETFITELGELFIKACSEKKS